MTTRIYVFPGQGSQKAGMGGDLFAQFRELTDQAGAELGYPIEELCLRDPERRLDLTQFTQPALYVVNALSFLGRLTEDGRLPHFVAGHSLGEYNALFAAGVFDFPTGLRLVKRRAQLMARATGGAMAAVIGLGLEKIRQSLEASGLASIDIANLNSPNQTVISGPAGDIETAQGILVKAGAPMVKRLNVSAAFHSRYMSEAEKEFASFLEPFEFAAPRMPVIANVTGQPHAIESIKLNLARQITHSVRWTESVQWLSRQPEPEFVEIGPGNVLTGLIRRIQKESPTPPETGEAIAKSPR